MASRRIENHIYLPLAIAIMCLVMCTYSASKELIIILVLFMLPSLLFNIAFVLMPLFAKTYIVLRISFTLLQFIISAIVIAYIVNLTLVLGTLTQCHTNSEKSAEPASMLALFLSHFLLQVGWMFVHVKQMLSLYYWIDHMRAYNRCLLEATFM